MGEVCYINISDISYEEIRDYIGIKKDALYSAYYQQINQAIEKAKRPPQVILNELANAFFQEYKLYQKTNYSSLDLRTKSTSNGYWAKYATKLNNVHLHHKISQGKIDLTFRGASSRMSDVERVAEWLRNHGLKEVHASIIGKAASIQVDVPKLNMEIPFSANDQYDIDKCFEVIKELIDAANVFAIAGSISGDKT